MAEGDAGASGRPAGGARGGDPGGPSADPRGNGGDGRRAAVDGPELDELRREAARAVEESAARVRAALDAGKRLARVQVDRARVAAREGALGLVLGLWAGLVGAVVTVLASIYLVRGLAGGFAAAAGGRPWVGALAAAVLVLGGTAVLLLLVRARLRRANLRKLVRKYER